MSNLRVLGNVGYFGHAAISNVTTFGYQMLTESSVISKFFFAAVTIEGVFIYMLKAACITKLRSFALLYLNLSTPIIWVCC